MSHKGDQKIALKDTNKNTKRNQNTQKVQMNVHEIYVSNPINQ